MAREDLVLRRLLVLGAETPALQRVVPMLLRSEFQAHRVERVDEAVDLLLGTVFDLLIVRYPIAGLSLNGLVQTVRTRTSPSRNAGLLLLAEPSFVDEVAEFLGRGINRVVSLDAPSERLLHAIADLVGVSPRRTVRTAVQLELWVANGSGRVLTMTENLSLGGMLIRGAREFGIGCRLSFALTLPGQPTCVRGKAEVVRHTDLRIERVEGIGVRFLSLGEGDPERLDTFLRLAPALS